MKARAAVALLIVLVSRVTHAETFIGPTSATNRLVVPTNSAIIITSTHGDFTNSTEVVLNGFGFAQPFAPLQSGSTYALAGPAELIFSNAAAITFYRITNATIRTQGIANDPIGLTIPTNKTMRLFGVPAPVNASLSRQGSGFVSFTLEPNQPAEFTGPATLSLSSGVFFPNGRFISYFIAEDGFVMPNQRAIAGPSGSYVVSVEKSFDMNKWSPVLLESTTDADHAFYRLRIQR